ncbi:Bardet-Biedl syndrome 7 protein homolog isoform X2 [Leptidea sinapis]|uniref:Bardet-Biedl syndrome 7 protein homolog isoform X2 n=1 Tax=Leptidea sinapis TaxID=189913 RepID=UPI0021C28547|nr:Bardet-Biedl syndrome 7 protein homolog isoform X2 [Leptidea sinapis]
MMEYDLSRIDYTLCGITYPDTLKILPSTGEKRQQKFAIGDKNGILQCLSIRDEEPCIHFKTLPGKPITCVHLALSSGMNTDKIFAASGNEVKGYTRKGKLFCAIETSVSETITSMCVIGNDIIICSGRSISYYKDLREMNSYMCEDRVLDVAAFTAPNSTRVRLLLLIANKGAIVVESGHLVTRMFVRSGPSRLAVPLTSRSTEICAYYGAADGSIGFLTYNEPDLKSQCLVDGHELGPVTCLGWFTNHLGSHLSVGRHDGSIQLYLINVDNVDDVPRLKFTYFCGEPVTSVNGGCIGGEEYELLVATFSGRIFGLRSRNLLESAGVNSIPADALVSRRAKLEHEVARLEKQTANERDKYQKSTRSLQSGVSVPPLLDVEYELTGTTKKGWLEARFISAVPLDMLFIYCSNQMEVHTDNVAVLNICPPQDEHSSDLLATVRCQSGTKRLWIRLRPLHEAVVTGSTKVLVYLLPAGAPRVARKLTFQFPVLPYYTQHEGGKLDEKRSWCELKVTGKFSVAEVTSWLSEALTGNLPRPSNNVYVARSHTLLRTVIICRYQRSLATFKTDDISAIAVFKDLITSCTTRKGFSVDISTDIPKDCCLSSLMNIKETIKSEYKIKQENCLRQAIRYTGEMVQRLV